MSYQVTYWPEQDAASPYFVVDAETKVEVDRYPTEGEALALYRELLGIDPPAMDDGTATTDASDIDYLIRTGGLGGPLDEVQYAEEAEEGDNT